MSDAQDAVAEVKRIACENLRRTRFLLVTACCEGCDSILRGIREDQEHACPLLSPLMIPFSPEKTACPCKERPLCPSTPYPNPSHWLILLDNLLWFSTVMSFSLGISDLATFFRAIRKLFPRIAILCVTVLWLELSNGACVSVGKHHEDTPLCP